MAQYTTSDTMQSGTALSAGAATNGMDIVGLLLPAGWDTATITLSQSIDGVTWANAYDTLGNEVTLQATAGRYVVIPPATLPGFAWIRLRSGTSGVPVNQTATRTFSWTMRNYGR